MSLLLDTPIGAIVAHDLETAKIFERYGIDFCCGGETKLGEACRQTGADPEEVVADLRKVEHIDHHTVDQINHLSPTELTAHIVQTHHDYLREALPRLGDLCEKVYNAHGEAHPELLDLQEAFQDLRNDIEAHLQKEEQVLFPHIQGLEEAYRQQSSAPEACFQSIRQPIAMMEAEHEDAGIALGRIRTLSNHYTAPPDACTSWQLLLRELSHLELDTHVHVAKENYVLHQLAREMEDALADVHSSDHEVSTVLRRLRQAD